MIGDERVAAGVDGCRAGWIAVIRAPGMASRIVLVSRFEALIDTLPGDAIVAVDMPIGLPERIGAGGRGPERAVRPLLGARQSSVFSIPARAAVYAADYAEACRLALERSDPPRKVSKQAFHIFPRIREIDALLRARPALAGRIVEAHPELAFCRLNGNRPMSLPKKIKGGVNPAGIAERTALLAANGYDGAFLRSTMPRGAKIDDFLDAAAVVLIAERYRHGTARPFPDPFDRDAFGLPMAIWA